MGRCTALWYRRSIAPGCGLGATRMPHELQCPPLPYDERNEACALLHLFAQIIGKVRLVQTPWINHSLHVVLYVTPSGLTTGAIEHGGRGVDIAFDFLAHELQMRTADGGERILK